MDLYGLPVWFRRLITSKGYTTVWATSPAAAPDATLHCAVCVCVCVCVCVWAARRNEQKSLR